MDNPEQLQIWNGCLVAIELKYQDGVREKMAFQIVDDELADFEQGFVGEGTPMAQAILGHVTGDEISYRVGDAEEIVILGVDVARTEPDRDVIERREASMRRALRQSELANLIAFASSFNSKWGDYDPKTLIDEWNSDD